MMTNRSLFRGSFPVCSLAAALLLAGAARIEAAGSVSVTVEEEKGIGVGFDQISEESQTLTIELTAPGDWEIQSSKRRYNAGDAIWMPAENNTRAKTHTYIVVGVVPDKGHAAAFEGKLTKDVEGEGDPPAFDVAVADLDVDLSGVEDKTEGEETGGLLLPPDAELTLDVAVRAEWTKLKKGPEAVHLGQVEFTVTGTGAAQIEIYDPDGTKLYPVQGTSRPVQIPADQKHYTAEYTIKTGAAFVGSATIEATFTWDGDIKADSTYTAKDVVRIAAIEFMININTHNKPKNGYGIPVVSTPADIDEADIPRRMSPGGYIWVNDDNDNPANPTTIDKDDFSVYEDNDLEPFTYTISQAVWEYGYTVEVVVGDSHLPNQIRLWQGNKVHELSSGEYSSLAALDFEAKKDAESGVLHIEGLQPTHNAATITFRLRKDAEVLSEDSIKVCVFGVISVTWQDNGDTTICPESHIPPPPGQVRGGNRVFPDRQYLGEPTDRDLPDVRIHLYPTLPPNALDWELPVYARVFDVDHYHNHVDFNPNGAGIPNDNQSPFTGYALEQGSDGPPGRPSHGEGNTAQIAIEVIESSVRRVIVNGVDQLGSDDVQWADVAGRLGDGSVAATATVRLLHHVPGNNWRIAAGCGDSIADAVELRTDPSPDPQDPSLPRPGVTIQYVDGTPLAISPDVSSTLTKSSTTLTVWRRVIIELAHMGAVNFTEGPTNVRTCQEGAVTGITGNVLHTAIDTPYFYYRQYADETSGVARCYRRNMWGQLTYLGARDIVIDYDAGRSHGDDINVPVDVAPPVDTNYVFIYDDDVDRTSILLVQDAPPNPVPKIQPRYPLHQYTAQPEFFPAACVDPDIRCGLSNIPFDLNVHDQAALENTLAGAKTRQGGELYWCVQCSGTYQYHYVFSHDGWDPRDGAFAPIGYLGLSRSFWVPLENPSARGTSIVFLETIRDFAQYVSADPTAREKRSVAHEIAHLFGARHGDGGVMDGAGDSYTPRVLRRIMLLHKEGPDQAAPESGP